MEDLSLSEQDLGKKLKSIRLPDCSQGELHEQLSQICVDVRCDLPNVFTILCSGCIEEKIHSKSHSHIQRQLKRVLLEINQVAYSKTEVTSNREQIEEKLQELSDQYKNLGNLCLQISDHFTQSIKELNQKSKEEEIVKVSVIKELERLSDLKEEKEIQDSIFKLKEMLKISADKISINNDLFEKQWAQFTNEQKLKITASQSLMQKLKNTKVFNFLEDESWKIGKTVVQKPTVDNSQVQNTLNIDQETLKKTSQLSNGSGQNEATSQSSIQQSSSQIQTPQNNKGGFGFSQLLKSPTIQITNGKIAKQTESCYKENRVALIEPPIHLDKKSFHAFQVIQQTGWMGIGVALQDIILRDNYKFTIEDINHGQFLISSNGYKWVHQNDNESGTESFKFSQYDIILCEYDPAFRRIRFKKKGSEKMAIIQLESSYGEDEQLYLCVNMTEKNDAIGLFVEQTPNTTTKTPQNQNQQPQQNQNQQQTQQQYQQQPEQQQIPQQQQQQQVYQQQQQQYYQQQQNPQQNQ